MSVQNSMQNASANDGGMECRVIESSSDDNLWDSWLGDEKPGDLFVTRSGATGNPLVLAGVPGASETASALCSLVISR
ncbi:hypothetical protein FOMG_18333 [Fusarium oxysporum f. sp. melonis 26406]|uniref:Uncharacterized protein n=2 Tax=Fusarium oxysporum TaxID=5507 RepID=W9Z8N8_FUSOX|nr:hypothetical protein FOVG_15897 [Fusarium oxysporum f. sp. pisi HDV247]EXK24977.1 hypothetical protein FOMG_18333 [Fusarium oxysporum f. sp. melonis 26406]